MSSPRRPSRTAVCTLAALATAGLLLAGCTSAAEPPAPAGTAPATAVAPSSSAPSGQPSGAASGSPTPSSAGPSSAASPAALRNPCDVIDVDEMSDLTGEKLTKKAPSTTRGGIQLCQYSGARTVPPVIAVTGPLPGTIDKAVEEIQQVATTSDVAKIEVDGADDARAFTGQAAGATQVYVIASSGQVVHGGILNSLGDTDGLRDKAAAIAERLLRG